MRKLFILITAFLMGVSVLTCKSQIPNPPTSHITTMSRPTTNIVFTPVYNIPTPTQGMVYYYLPENLLMFYNGSSWDTLNTAGSGGSGIGDVLKVGTPINDQVAIWTGNGTVEGSSALTFNGTNLTTTGTVTSSGLIIGSANISESELEILDDALVSTSELNQSVGLSGNIQTQLNAKQNTLVSGTNIRTINGTSVLGSGDITTASGSGDMLEEVYDTDGNDIVDEAEGLTGLTLPTSGELVSRDTIAKMISDTITALENSAVFVVTETMLTDSLTVIRNQIDALTTTLNSAGLLVTSINVASLSGATIINTDGGSLDFEADVEPNTAIDTSLTWSYIAGTGTADFETEVGAPTLTALTDGTVTVRATANDGSGVYGEEEITISNQGGTYPSVLDDGNTVGWYIGGSSYVTTDGSDSVTVWLDQSGNDNHLTATDETGFAPIIEGDSIVFNGTTQVLSIADLGWAATSEAGSNMIYIVFKANSHTYADNIIRSVSTGAVGLTQWTTNDLRISSSTGSGGQSGLYEPGEWLIGTFLVDGANSRLAINDETPGTYDTGIYKFGGFSVGGNATGTAASDIEVLEIICRQITDDASGEDAIYTYLQTRYGF